MVRKSDHDRIVLLELRVWMLERLGYGIAAFLIWCGVVYLFPKVQHLKMTPDSEITQQ
jgi:hypothetical protein